MLRVSPAIRALDARAACLRALGLLVLVWGVGVGVPAAHASDGATRLALNDGPAPKPIDDATPLGGGSSQWDDDDWLDDEFDLDDEYDALGDDDPFEPFNRAVFSFNHQVDRFALTPITGVYQTLVPSVGRTGIHNVFLNLDAPVRMTNAMLQRRPRASGIALARFIVNTTFGLGGLIDVGNRVGLAEQKADFGQTLASFGTPQGPYMVFPFLGPMTVRHGIGMGVDFVMQPVSYVVGPLPGMIVGAGKDFSRREQVEGEIEALRDTSLDFYAALRSAFLQDRADLIASGAQDSRIADVASAGSDSRLAHLTPEEREARCLSHVRARREQARGTVMRMQVTRRCARAADH